MDRLTSMAVFVKTVDLGSFAATAAALDLSGPMVGKHVRFLEERLGVRLINRTTRRQSLTDFGRAYYERCRMVIAEAEAADALAADQLSEPRGKLRVIMPVHFGRRCVAPILLELAQQYPSLELDLSFSDPLADLAEDGCDLAIRTGNLEDQAGVMARRIARQRMVVCASPSYLEMHGWPQQIGDLGSHQAIIYRRSGRVVQPWLFPRNGQPALEVMPVSRLRLDDLDAIADVAAAGMGLAWLPYWLVRERIQAGALVPLLPEQPGFLYDAYALWLQTPHLPLKVRLAVDALAAGLPRLMT
ncbi:LysR family transcriptional regulator [Mesorhizobium sp. M6A.T.Ce.TU.002.03.1.1]|uniref:LysR family transcriptional regulator n=1 Tax=unclassified Mesorhizobium TaxID=325217 RepID=UPI000FCBE215|nr:MULTISPECIES: LysR family transcriptional regulator [unclassified Mesorhizobium]RUU29533.1 LysR family transcriptional regulator [Mesorhizobium sp. M6A.T.Ce.TU.016.01.1.1]RUU45116.1 LysR family transcriptional regulator [Mesorhizobium sp. M6A.T.Ce.TU.002.03.1.1]RUU97176.1 LysR family transcriptional regulator [Mesorhizobium sp. M6A.T.Cr.TU.017.01.1.1]RWO95804.1 MAG: LysR family transcriptional regulator [Mesorhizobium sp.]TIM34140.1 MAG: LysR family transcriptional regulator [Mesorhizobium 